MARKKRTAGAKAVRQGARLTGPNLQVPAISDNFHTMDDLSDNSSVADMDPWADTLSIMSDATDGPVIDTEAQDPQDREARLKALQEDRLVQAADFLTSMSSSGKAKRAKKAKGDAAAGLLKILRRDVAVPFVVRHYSELIEHVLKTVPKLLPNANGHGTSTQEAVSLCELLGVVVLTLQQGHSDMGDLASKSTMEQLFENALKGILTPALASKEDLDSQIDQEVRVAAINMMMCIVLRLEAEKPMERLNKVIRDALIRNILGKKTSHPEGLDEDEFGEEWDDFDSDGEPMEQSDPESPNSETKEENPLSSSVTERLLEVVGFLMVEVGDIQSDVDLLKVHDTCLKSGSLGVQSAAGKNFAMFSESLDESHGQGKESDSDENVSSKVAPAESQLISEANLKLMSSLSRAKNRHLTKKQNCQKRAVFRRILSTVQDGRTAQTRLVVFGEEANVEGWVQLRVLEVVKGVLKAGLLHHLAGNAVVRSFFDLPPPRTGERVDYTQIHRTHTELKEKERLMKGEMRKLRKMKDEKQSLHLAED